MISWDDAANLKPLQKVFYARSSNTDWGWRTMPGVEVFFVQAAGENGVLLFSPASPTHPYFFRRDTDGMAGRLPVGGLEHMFLDETTAKADAEARSV